MSKEIQQQSITPFTKTQDASHSLLDSIVEKTRVSAPDVIFDDNAFARIKRLADTMAASGQAVPMHCRNNPGLCFAVALQANAWGLRNPWAVAAKTYVEPKSDRLCYEAQLIIAAAQSSGVIVGHFEYEYDGDGDKLKARAGARLADGDGSISWGEWQSISAITVRLSPLWKVDPRQQMAYSRAVSWVRSKYPGIIMGVYSTDEIIDSAGSFNSAPIAEVDLSTSLDEVNSIIAEINSTSTPAEQKLIRPKVEAITGKHRSSALNAYSARTKYFKELALESNKPVEPEKPVDGDITGPVADWLSALESANSQEELDAVWEKIPDDLGEHPILVAMLEKMEKTFMAVV